jgi:hypothetical protein
MRRLTRGQIIGISVAVALVVYGLIRFSKRQREKRAGGNLPDCSIWDRFAQLFGAQTCEQKTREAIDWAKTLDNAINEAQDAGFKSNQIHEATKGSNVISDTWLTFRDGGFSTSSKSEYLLHIMSYVQNDLDFLVFSRVYGTRENCKYLVNCNDLDLTSTLSKEMKQKEKNTLNSLYYSRGITYTI